MSFGTIASDYDRLRPSAPGEAIDWLLPERRQVVVDLGAGTGLLTRALAGKAGHVIAVEPDDRMRAVLTARTPGAEVMAGRGEDIPVPDASADVVLVSSAWHWLDPDLAVPEIARILRDADGWASSVPAGTTPPNGCGRTCGSPSRPSSSLRRSRTPTARTAVTGWSGFPSRHHSSISRR